MIAWIKRWGWYVVVAVVASIGALVLRRSDLWEKIGLEREVVDAKAIAELRLVELGTVRATALVREEHAQILRDLDEKYRLKAARLHEDPIALAALLTRLSGGSGAAGSEADPQG